MMASEFINLVYDPWLAKILQRDVYKLIIDNDFLKSVRSEFPREYNQLRDLQSKRVFIYSKVLPEALLAVRFLERRGFKLIDTNITFDT